MHSGRAEGGRLAGESRDKEQKELEVPPVNHQPQPPFLSPWGFLPVRGALPGQRPQSLSEQGTGVQRNLSICPAPAAPSGAAGSFRLQERQLTGFIQQGLWPRANRILISLRGNRKGWGKSR